jgi:transcriptional regulator GlxA family with amidase domain
MRTEARPSILLLAAEETSPSVLYGLYDVLYSVGAVYPDMTVGTPGPEALDVRIVAAEAEPFRCIGNVVVEPHEALSEADAPSAVVVCDMYTPIHAPPKGRYKHEVAWLRDMHEKGSLMCSVCSGSLLLAEAGLLDGRHAAAHWAYRDLFKRHYPEIGLLGEQMLCLSEEADGIVTAGGVTAWHDLAIYLIARYCGQRQALQTAKVFLFTGHAEGQLPYAAMTRPQTSDDGAIGACLNWIGENYAAASPVERMIERSGLNQRTFSRRFRAATGYAPIEYVQALRIEEAKQILETDELDIDEVGAAVGYEDPVSFRRVFKRLAGLTPASYRRKFRQIVAFTAGPGKPALQ